MEGTAKLNALLLLIRGDNLGHPRSGIRFACINGRSVLALHIGQGLRADIGTSRAEPGDHIADIFIGSAAPAIGTAYAVLGTKGKAAFVKVNDFSTFFTSGRPGPATTIITSFLPVYIYRTVYLCR